MTASDKRYVFFPDESINRIPMKNFRLLLLFLPILLLAVGCGDDDDGLQEDILQHDGPNLTGPILDFGLHELSARFTASELAPFEGRRIESVRFFLGDIPAGTEVVIYGEGSPDRPGSERYSRDITNRITTTGWNEHVLNSPVEIGDEDIWITIAVLHDQRQQSVGCDAGPAQPGGDFIFYADEPDWLTFRDATGESVNWNIRAVLQPE